MYVTMVPVYRVTVYTHTQTHTYLGVGTSLGISERLAWIASNALLLAQLLLVHMVGVLELLLLGLGAGFRSSIGLVFLPFVIHRVEAVEVRATESSTNNSDRRRTRDEQRERREESAWE